MERTALIMAGGSGQRFWPLSRRSEPKQFLKLFSDISLVRLSFLRVNAFIGRDNIFIVCPFEYKVRVLEEIPEFSPENLIIEPFARDTAAAIGLGVIYIRRRLSDASILVCASDHIIDDELSFRSNVNMGFTLAEDRGCIITIGIKPSRPETNYGYIELGDSISISSGDKVEGAYRVRSFREKPDYVRARLFLESSNFLWNSGMFIFKASVILEELSYYASGLHSGLLKIESVLGSVSEDEVKGEVYLSLSKVSIDFAVMERTDNIFCISADFIWDDVGSWNSYFRFFDKDGVGNISRGQVATYKTRGSLILGDTDSFIGVVGLSNVIVVKTKDALLLCDRDSDADIKGLLEDMGNNFSSYL